jgi:hypothetical protein
MKQSRRWAFIRSIVGNGLPMIRLSIYVLADTPLNAVVVAFTLNFMKMMSLYLMTAHVCTKHVEVDVFTVK